jgi:hypothetical protein
MTMTTSQDTVGDTARRAQGADANVMKLWLNNFKVFGWLPTPEPKLFHEFVDTSFDVAARWCDVAQQVLGMHRQFAHAVVMVATTPESE